MLGIHTKIIGSMFNSLVIEVKDETERTGIGGRGCGVEFVSLGRVTAEKRCKNFVRSLVTIWKKMSRRPA
jgi:hypothetical protein